MLGSVRTATASTKAVPLAEFTAALKRLIPMGDLRHRIGVAVSGGSDSMALAALLFQHREKEGWPENVTTYTIDHGVRIGSTAEAKEVEKKMKRWGFRARILTLNKDLQDEFEQEIPGNLEAVLRTERFNLLLNAAKEDGVYPILQGHHQDDQYETVLQRLAWGSTLAGLGGIPERNGPFVRPLLAYPKASLRATCRESDVNWIEDPTNAVTTYAMRNAIRSIVDNQDNLPLALRRENILAVQRKGDAFRTDLIKRIDHMMGLCRFSIELFNKTIRAQVPQSLYQVPERVLRHFVPALIRIWREGAWRTFQFNGTAEDSSSITFMEKFYKFQTKQARFNLQGVEIIKKKQRPDGRFEFLVKPEIPRHALRKHEIELKPMQPPTNQQEWRDYYFEFPKEWPQMHQIKVRARGNTKFYFRHWEEGKKGDTRIIDVVQKELRGPERMKWENVQKRMREYPACLYAVLCHREESPNFPKKKVEWIDAVPQFGLHVNPNVWTSTDGTYDLRTPEPEWKELKKVTRSDDGEDLPPAKSDAYAGLRPFNRRRMEEGRTADTKLKKGRERPRFREMTYSGK